MSDDPPASETSSVGVKDGVVVVTRHRVWADGTKLGGDFVIDPANAGWLADTLDAAAQADIPRTTHDAGADHLAVYTGGGERDAATLKVFCVNTRDAGATRGGRDYTISGMSPALARQIAGALRAQRP